MRTEVCITVDVEFSIAGAFSHPERFKPIGHPVVRCMVDGRDEGLGFLLRSLSEFAVPATFFVEAMQTAYFGDGPMKEIAAEIVAAGQDVQLHAHPCWLFFENPGLDRSSALKNDSCAGRTPEELDRLLAQALATFSRWGLQRPVAFRTGNLHTDRTLYQALARAGIPISSSIGTAIYRPAEAGLALWGGRHLIDGVLELPVLSYRDMRFGNWNHIRPLSINACSTAEIEFVLREARRLGISPVTLITHPGDFVKKTNKQYTELRRNRVIQRRFRRLLQFLRDHDDQYVAVSIAARKDAWLSCNATQDPEISVPLGRVLGRVVENGINNHIWRF